MQNLKHFYHGTLSVFNKVDLNHSKDRKDFGRGFYVTTDIHQAEKLALSRARYKAKLGETNVTPLVYHFAIPESELSMLRIKMFWNSIEWLDCVFNNRTNRGDTTIGYDIVTGKVADVNVQKDIQEYEGSYDMCTDEDKLKLIAKLRPERLTDQFCFKTMKSVQLLNKYFVEVIKL